MTSIIALPPATLVLRETLLGALSGRLEDPSNLSLHASDFHVAVDQIGLVFGSKGEPGGGAHTYTRMGD